MAMGIGVMVQHVGLELRDAEPLLVYGYGW
jgi:hypothetical protein